MTSRGTWQGMTSIVRFNWPLYAVAFLVLTAALAGLILMESLPLRLACAVALAGACYFIVVSLGVSHLVYDRSDLYRFRWLDRALGGASRSHIVFCHSGLDEVSERLKDALRPEFWITLDHFDSEWMTEASIRRARKLHPPSPGTISTPFDSWPVDTSSIDIVFGLLAIHEFRSEMERTRWFEEARRCLKPGGRIVIAEHLRDPANFLAFGPGFLHFHSPASWRRCWEAAGFRKDDEFPVTSWVRVYILVPT